jgi:uracil-DNA glycosylase family 4
MAITQSEIKILNNINEAAKQCRRCNLYKNGSAFPQLNPNIKAIIMGEACGAEEVKQGIPFVGKAGQILWEAFAKHNMNREDFLIINACNCRPIITINKRVKNGKPLPEQMEQCRALNTLYLRNCDVTYVMTLGNYPKWFFTNQLGNINADAGKIIQWDNKKVMFNFHPASLIYNRDNKILFDILIEKFVKLVNEQ